ncbi:MAG: GNAT family N-acetyltransferase [Candidatus Omnitrophota bacterium]
MPEEPKIHIRKFEVKDRQVVRSIIHDAALMGDSASLFFEGREIISDALSLYFTDYEPESCFVAEVNSVVAGCLIGAKNKTVSEKVIAVKISPRLFWKALNMGAFLQKKNIIFIFRCVSGLFTDGLKTPDVTKEYPATLHINIKKEFRGLHVGSNLMGAFLEYLKENKISGVHLATMSDAAANFFSKHGFELLYKGKRSYFRHILHRDVPLYLYGKKL